MNKDKERSQSDQDLKGPRLLPLKKVADYLGLAVWAMRERIWAGDIPVMKLPSGRKRYIDIEDIEEFIQKKLEGNFIKE